MLIWGIYSVVVCLLHAETSLQFGERITITIIIII